LPAPAVEASAIARSNAELDPRPLGALDRHRDSNPGSRKALDTVARGVPVRCQGGRAFIPLARDQRFEVGVQLSRPNLLGFALISRWESTLRARHVQPEGRTAETAERSLHRQHGSATQG
jgi:hypothetical protein